MKLQSRITMTMLAAALLTMAALTGTAAAADDATSPPRKDTVRTCVIAGATMVGLWPEICERFTAATGYEVVLVATSSRPGISKHFRRGEADLIAMHSGDITTNLVADGYGVGMRPWARNDLVIVGPASDPAGIRGMKSGVEALKRIAETRSPFVDNRANGPRELGHTLWSLAGVDPIGDWVIKEESESRNRKLAFAERNGAYMIFGRMPVTHRKVAVGGMEIMVEDDPAMRRPYIVMTANPEVFPDANVEGALAMADFMLSKEIQEFLLTFGLEKNGGKPVFYPVWPYGERVNQ